MAYNPYGGNPYGAPPYNPYPGAGQVPGMVPPGFAPPLGMSSAPGMAPPPGVHQPPSAPLANRLSGLPPSFQPPPNLPNINFNAPVIRLGGPVGGVPPTGPGASSLPARPGIPPAHGGGYGGRHDPETPLSATSTAASGTPMRPDFRADRFGGDRSAGGYGGSDHRFDRFDHHRGDRFERGGGGGGGGGDHRGDRGDRGDRGGDRGPGLEQSRAAVRDSMHSQAPPTNDEKLRTIFVHGVPEAGVGGEAGLERLVSLAGHLRRWDAAKSHLSDHKGEIFGFAQYEDVDSLAAAIELLKSLVVPVEKQEPKDAKGRKHDAAGKNGDHNGDHDMKDADDDDETKPTKKEKKNGTVKEEADGSDDEMDDEEAEDPFNGIKKVRLQIAVDPVSFKYIEAVQEKQSDEAIAEAKVRRDASEAALKAAVHDLFFPPKHATNGDVKMTDAAAAILAGGAPDGLDIANIPLASQEDELADIPAEVREMVAKEIAMFRDRSTQRDLERLQREQEMEELERRRNGDEPTANRSKANGRHVSPSASSGAALPSRKGIDFVNGHGANYESDPDTDASDEELYRRKLKKQQAEDDKQYAEAERKWANRERQRAAALQRERERDRDEADNAARRREEALERDRAWDDEREASRKTSLYYRDHAAWLRKRAQERADEEARDAADERAEQEERRKQAAEQEAARGMADSFLEQQADLVFGGRTAPTDTEKRKDKTEAAAAAPQRVTISFGAAAQRNQAARGGAGVRHTVAEVEGLLDDEEQDGTQKRRLLVPIQFEPMTAAERMADEELNQAVRGLVQEIPTDKAGLWAWPVQWAHLDEAVLRDKLRPFVEKKVVEYLGVQEQLLVEVVENHLRQHGSPEALVEGLQEALDEAAEDLVKKLWRMVIFFTESEKRGLPT